MRFFHPDVVLRGIERGDLAGAVSGEETAKGSAAADGGFGAGALGEDGAAFVEDVGPGDDGDDGSGDDEAFGGGGVLAESLDHVERAADRGLDEHGVVAGLVRDGLEVRGRGGEMDYVVDVLDGFVVCIFCQDVRDQDEVELGEIWLGGMCGFDFLDPGIVADGGSDAVACFQGFDQGAVPDETGGTGDEDELRRDCHYYLGYEAIMMAE